MIDNEILSQDNVNVWIYHHNDADGFGAAAAIAPWYCKVEDINDSLKVTIPDNVHFMPVNYNHPTDFTNVEKDDIVYCLDYTPGREEDIASINALYEKFGENFTFIVIDHHKTALSTISKCEGLKAFLEKRGCIFPTEDFEQAGCALVYIMREMGGDSMLHSLFYRYYFLDDKTQVSTTRDIFANYMLGAEEWIKWTADHDIFSERYPESHIFSKAVYNEGLQKTYLEVERRDSFITLESIIYFMKYHPASEIGEKYNLEYYIHHLRTITYGLHDTGMIIDEIMTKQYRSALHGAFEISIYLNVTRAFIDPNNDMHLNYNDEDEIEASGKILCLNAVGNSGVFLDKIADYDACILFTFDGDTVKYSIYSNKFSKFPCNVLAVWGGKQYGISGGGHTHAAGFYSQDIVFRKDMHYTVIDNHIESLPNDTE